LGRILSFSHLYTLTVKADPIQYTLISASKIRRNSEKLREQVRLVLSLLDEMEQYRMRKTPRQSSRI